MTVPQMVNLTKYYFMAKYFIESNKIIQIACLIVLVVVYCEKISVFRENREQAMNDSKEFKYCETNVFDKFRNLIHLI